MGFFKSLHDLTKEAKDLEKTMPPPGERARAATSQMAALTQSMAAQTQALNTTLGGTSAGVEATATVVAARTVGMVNFDPLMEVDLTVMREGMPPYPATVRQAINQVQAGLLQAGGSVSVRVDPDNPATIWIDMTRMP